MITIELEELKDRIEARKRTCKNISDEYVHGKYNAYTTIIEDITKVIERMKKDEQRNISQK